MVLSFKSRINHSLGLLFCSFLFWWMSYLTVGPRFSRARVSYIHTKPYSVGSGKSIGRNEKRDGDRYHWKTAKKRSPFLIRESSFMLMPICLFGIFVAFAGCRSRCKGMRKNPCPWTTFSDGCGIDARRWRNSVGNIRTTIGYPHKMWAKNTILFYFKLPPTFFLLV